MATYMFPSLYDRLPVSGPIMMDLFKLADLNFSRVEQELLRTVSGDNEAELAGIENILGYWELVVAVVGTPANALVLYLTAKFLRLRSRSPSTRSSHQASLWFVFSMTLADLLFTSVHAPMAFIEYTLRVQYDSAGCFTRYVLTNASMVSSSISLLWLNLDKFLYLNKPLHYRCFVTTRRALGAALAGWAVGLVWSLFFMLGPFTKYIPPCTFRPSNIYLYIAFALAFFVIPTAVCLAVSAYIACVVIRVNQRRAKRTVSGQHDGRRSLGTSARTIAFVFTTTVWAAVTYLPYRIAYLIYISPVFPADRPAWLMRLLYFLAALLATNALGNPFITVLTQRQYSASLGLKN